METKKILILVIFISGCAGKPPAEPSGEVSIGEPQSPSQELPEQEEIWDEDAGVDDGGFIQSESWRSEVADDDGWVGIDVSIAVDARGSPHISHYDQGSRDLKYAYWTGDSWHKETVDSAGDVGEESGIAVDSDGNPHISYIDAASGGLKYAQRKDGLWSIETVDLARGYHVVTTSIALDTSDHPRIVYNMEADDGELVKYASWDGGSWRIETVSPTGGIDVYLALDSNNDPHVVFVKEGSGDEERIHYARKISGRWMIEVVDSSTISGGDSGIAVDSKDHPHIVYHDYGRGAIKYASWDGASWGIETVATDVGREEGLRVAVDAKDKPHVIYSDSNKELLMYAAREGGSWIRETVSRMGIPSIAVDYLGRVHVAHGYTTEGETEILKYSIRE